MYEDNVYDYGYDSITPISATETDVFSGVMAMIVLSVILFAFAIVVYVISSIFLGKVFKKAGVDPIKAWIPIYNNWKVLEIGGQQGFWAILYLIPGVGIVTTVMMIIATHNINKKIGYDIGMTVLYIFAPLIWVIIAGINKNPWNESLGSPRTDTPVIISTPQATPQTGQPQPPQSFQPTGSTSPQVTPAPTEGPETQDYQPK